MSKRDQLLKNKREGPETYSLNEDEQMQLAALLELVQQAQRAQDIIFTNIVQSAAARCGVKGAGVNINMEEVQTQGVSVAKLIVTR